ncbi:hypothetical protein QFC21_005775 [Naganishia friedmannii]|uniref:Uncharacterized protein n=1 Tax=Naganishia friedmannii TaxID=89922 RepID=A0ACC2V8U7_9TREE|nr:hypothetical protein QFC21_005775 [Naganishia friedmannii]
MNYQDTLPKKRVAEALAAADRAGGRSETLGSVNRSRSGSRGRIRDLKHEPNASSPAERNALHRGESGSTSRVSNEQGHSPPSRRLSVAGSVYEDDSWLFPERMSYIHGDPEDMFDIYDDSLAPLAATQQTAVYGQQHAIPQNFTSHLQHRFSGPGFGQLYSNGQSHPSMLHQTGQSNANHFSIAQNAAVDLNNQIALGYGDSLNRISQNAGPNSAPGFAPVAKGFSNGQSHNNTLVTPLSSTGLALTVDHPYNNQHNQHQNQHLHQSNADASVNIGHLELNKNLEWTHSSNGGPSAPVNLEDPLMQLLAGGSYHPLHADAPASARLYQTQRSDNSRMPSQDQNHCTTAPSTSVQRLPPSISARDFESSFQPLDPLSAGKSLWSGQNDDQHGLRTQILEYYTHTLSKLVSCDHVDQEERHDAAETAPGARRAAGFDVFRSLASSSTTLLERAHGDTGRTLLPKSRMHHPSSSISGVSPELNPAHILHMALLAWSGRHSLNRGEARHEAASEDWGKRAEAMLARLTDGKEEQTAKHMRQIEKHPSDSSAEQVEGNGSQRPNNRAEIPNQGGSGHVAHVETAPLHGNPGEASRLTTLAACLMVVQWKNCRGDISGFQSTMARVKALSTEVFFPDQKRPLPGTMEFHFMENLLYKDVLSTSIYVNEPILDQAALQSYFRQQPTVINTLTGLAWPVFTTMYRIAGLIRKKRERASASARKGNAWNYDELVDLVSEAEKIQQDLDTEKRLIDEVIESE